MEELKSTLKRQSLLTDMTAKWDVKRIATVHAAEIVEIKQKSEMVKSEAKNNWL